MSKQEPQEKTWQQYDRQGNYRGSVTGLVAPIVGKDIALVEVFPELLPPPESYPDSPPHKGTK